jgi:hypothetical protein
MHALRKKNKTIHPKKKTVLRYMDMLSPKNDIIGKWRKNAPIEPSSGSGHPAIFYLKRFI